MREVVESIQKEISEKRLYNTVKEVSNFHRIQASTGFREAAEFVHHKLDKMGIENQILSFVADENHWYLQQRLFQEWNCNQAYLRLINEDLELANFEEEPISIIQKSYPCDYRNEPLNIVLVESNDPQYLDTLELKGALAFIHTMPNQYLYSVIKERGAVGFVTDFMREVKVVRSRNDAYDTLNYTSFWWSHDPEEPQPFGFVLSPRMGDYLKKLCLQYEANYQKDPSLPRYPTAHAYVDSSLYPGYMEVVEATVKGESDEVVMMSAHLCHPRSCANDNSSGVAGSIEALRVLKSLQDQGKIKLQKTVKLILIPEYTGTFCYMSTFNDYSHIKGAVNMDMIGGRQNGYWGPITITKTHQALNSPINMIASRVLKYVRGQVSALTGTKVPMVNSVMDEYTGGSDHTVMCDTTIGIPCLMLGQWPDKYYHTSSDTLECVDPKVLAFSTSFAASYMYALSNFDEDLHQEVLFDGIHMMYEDMEKAAKQDDEYKSARLHHLVEYYQNCVSNFTKLADVDNSKDADMIATFGNTMVDYLTQENKAYPLSDDPRVPYRKFVGPIRSIDAYNSKGEKQKAAVSKYQEIAKPFGWEAYEIGEYVVNYMDGIRSVAKIEEAIYLELGHVNKVLLNAYIDLLVELDLAGIK